MAILEESYGAVVDCKACQREGRPPGGNCVGGGKDRGHAGREGCMDDDGRRSRAVDRLAQD